MPDLTPDEIRGLIVITTHQFSYWQEAIRQNTNLDIHQKNSLETSKARDDWKHPDFLNWWFILTHLYIQPSFRAPKRDVTGWEWKGPNDENPPKPLITISGKHEVPGAIPGIGHNTARRYMGQLLTLELIEKVGKNDLQLTEAGKNSIETTVAKWHVQFGELHESYLTRTGRIIPK